MEFVLANRQKSSSQKISSAFLISVFQVSGFCSTSHPLITGHVSQVTSESAFHVSAFPLSLSLNSQLFCSLKSHGSAQHFDRVSADANTTDALALACRMNKDFTRPSGFQTLVDDHLLV